MDHTIQPLIGLSLCHGIGGLDQGVERAIAALRGSYRNEGGDSDRVIEYAAYGDSDRVIEYAAYVEIEAAAAWNLVAKMEKGLLAPAPVWTDVKTFPYEQFYRKVHIFTGGYPCQPFSNAGLQGGTDDPRHIFPFIEHGIDAARPVLCFFENVANHLNIGYNEVRRRISRLGYKVEADIFSAQHVGAPHLRKRLFIMAVADTYCNEHSKRRGDLAQVLGLSKVERQSEYSAVVSGGDSKSMGNTNCQGQQQSTGVISESGRRTEDSGNSVDHTIDTRLQRQPRYGNAKKQWEDTVRSIAATSFFPAGQGDYQHSWEHPRLEPVVGFAINGYDHREDLLRMGGNSVVPQAAELAFRMLIRKFL